MSQGSEQLFQEAKQHLVGGVNSPVRAFNSVGGNPVFMTSGSGPNIHSEDNKSYVDYVLSFGPLILGHAHPDIVQTIQDEAKLGTSFGAPTQKETALAQCIKGFYPYVDKVRFVSSGTEAVMSSIRLARGVTKKSIIIKFRGCYHGHTDALLVAAGSGLATAGVPDSAGVLADSVKHTLVLDYNDEAAVKEAFQTHKDDIAAVLIEPVAGNMGLVLPKPSFMATLRDCCSSHHSLLIFDEVMCGFRSQHGGTHTWIGVEPDIVVLGKVIGGGLPCAAYAARAEIMNHLAPEGPIYQAGTLSGNPLAMAVGLKTLTLLQDEALFNKAVSYTDKLVQGLRSIIKEYNCPAQVSQKGSMFTLFFTEKPINCFEDVQSCDFERFSAFFHGMLNEGVYLPPSQYEACFSSVCHDDNSLEVTLKAAKTVISGLMGPK